MITHLEGIPQPNYGCGFGDISCDAQEAVARFLVSSISSISDFMADMLTSAFKSSRPGAAEWQISSAEFWFWVGAMGIVLVVVAIMQMIPAMLLNNGKRVAQIALGLAGAIPTSVLSVWGMKQLCAYGDAVTDSLMGSVQGGGMGQAILHVFGFTDVNGTVTMNTDSALMNSSTESAKSAAAVGTFLVTILILAVMALASLVLYVSMSIRGFSLIVLAGTAPIGLMMIGQPKVAAWAHRWANLTIGLILAEPLAASVLLIAVLLLGHGVNTGLLLVAAGAVFAAAFAPVWAVKLVSFAGHETAGALAARPKIRDNANRTRTVMNIFRMGR
ncbi:hypothetical protein ACIRCZ_19470 [Leifsonia sp. NPDC102414]|uniref:hypothetical protein n=1 Tax=Leifsonia sp. NPDC102414 TaxID=3364124 RepID=UPI0038298FE2